MATWRKQSIFTPGYREEPQEDLYFRGDEQEVVQSHQTARSDLYARRWYTVCKFPLQVKLFMLNFIRRTSVFFPFFLFSFSSPNLILPSHFMLFPFVGVSFAWNHLDGTRLCLLFVPSGMATGRKILNTDHKKSLASSCWETKFKLVCCFFLLFFKEYISFGVFYTSHHLVLTSLRLWSPELEQGYCSTSLSRLSHGTQQRRLWIIGKMGAKRDQQFTLIPTRQQIAFIRTCVSGEI